MSRGLEELKMAIVLRADIKMGKGKLVSQACHAAIEAYESARAKSPDLCATWREQGAKKIVLKVDSLQALLELAARAAARGLPHALIVDRGLTQIPPNTPTALGIGPAPSSLLDQITGSLKLL